MKLASIIATALVLSTLTLEAQMNNQPVIDAINTQLKALQTQLDTPGSNAPMIKNQMLVLQDDLDFINKGYSPAKAATISSLKNMVRTFSEMQAKFPAGPSFDQARAAVQAKMVDAQTKLDAALAGPKE